MRHIALPEQRTMRAVALSGATVAVLLAFAFTMPAAFAFYLPSFQLEECAWHATDIVVVTEGKEIDGEVRVLETWTGERKRGETLSIPDLAGFARDDARAIWDGAEKDTGKRVSGDRIVLFLRRKDNEWVGAQGEERYAGIGIASAWIDGGKAHVRAQLARSGPQLFYESQSETDLRKRTLEIRAAKEEFARAMKIEEPKRRATALAKLVRGDVRGANRDAAAEIEKLPQAIATSELKALVADSDLGSVGTIYAAHALIRVAPKDAGPAIVAALDRETERWLAWKPDDERSTSREIHDRADKCQYLIEAIAVARYSEGLPAVRRFREALESQAPLRPYRSTIGSSCARVERLFAPPASTDKPAARPSS